MNRRLATVLVVLTATISARSQAQTGGCHAPSTESTQGLGWLTSLVSSTRPGAATLRTSLHITSGSQVTLVATDSVCTSTAKARAAEMQVPYDSAAIYVYKVGNLYVADEHFGTANTSERGYRAMHFFDLSYNFVGIAGR